MPAGLLPNVVFTDQADVRMAIQHERRVEFGFEFHRYFDVIRWGAAYAHTSHEQQSGLYLYGEQTFSHPAKRKGRGQGFALKNRNSIKLI